MNDHAFGRCGACGRKLLLNPDNGLCVMCEISLLRGRIAELELRLSQCRKEKQALYAKLSEARAQGVR